MAIGFFVFTLSTLWPLDNIGVITMKMISMTSITSTMGVTLISATGGGATCLIITIISPTSTGLGLPNPGSPSLFNSPKRTLLSHATLRSLQEVVDQLRARVAHLDVEGLDPACEQVEHPDRRDGHEQTDRGGHQGFGNAAGDRAEAGGLILRNTAERVDDADHSAEQSY